MVITGDGELGLDSGE